MGGIYNTVNFHLYHYAGIRQRSDSELQANNPVKYTDLDGRVQRSLDGNIIFWAPRNSKGEFEKSKMWGNSGNLVSVIHGYIKANDGTKISVFYNLDRDLSSADNYDCHGLTFTNGEFWIDNDQIEKLLAGDGYTQTNTPNENSIMIQRDENGNIIHSATVLEYDKKNNRVKIKEAMGSYQFDRNGKKYNSIIRWHNINRGDSFFNRPKDKIISNAGAEQT